MKIEENKNKDKYELIDDLSDIRVFLRDEIVIPRKNYLNVSTGIFISSDKNERLIIIDSTKIDGIAIESYILDSEIYRHQIEVGIYNTNDYDIAISGHVFSILSNKEQDSAEFNIPKGYWKTDELYLATNSAVTVNEAKLSEFPDGHFEAFVSYNKNK